MRCGVLLNVEKGDVLACHAEEGREVEQVEGRVVKHGPVGFGEGEHGRESRDAGLFIVGVVVEAGFGSFLLFGFDNADPDRCARDAASEERHEANDTDCPAETYLGLQGVEYNGVDHACYRRP